MSDERSGDRILEESAALRARRAAAGLEAPGETDDRWGLALSGGGIRSATFCLGMIRGLAGHRLLRRFDYLSTVSGGGYLGASLGRLFRPGVSAEAVEQGVAGERSLWLWWLRANSRYLTPSGARDLAQAWVSIARGAVATQLELGILLILVSAVLVLPHVLVTLWPALHDLETASLPSAWWLLAPLPFFLGAWRLFEFWLSRPRPVPGGPWWMPLYALGLAVLGMCVAGLDTLISVLPPKMGEPFAALPTPLRAMLATLLFAAAWAMLTGMRAVLGMGGGDTDAEDAEYALRARRNRLTRALLHWTLVFIAVLAAGLIDRLSWELTGLIGDARSAGMVYGSAGFAAFGLMVFRALMPAFQQWKAKYPGQQLRLDKVLSVVVFAMLAVIVLGWATLVHALVLPESLWQFDDTGADPAAAMYGGLVWSVLFFASLGFVYLTRNNYDIVNMASLHGFYRARIERAYVSSGNVGGAAPRFRIDPLAPIDTGMPRARPPDEVVAGDDVRLADYAPQATGGPIHLINCCINQSVDDGTRYFNGDRKGVGLTLSSLGTLEVGTAAPEPLVENAGYLSKWIAISGAAAGSGMGYQTAPAYSALLFLSGMRLGYWQRRMSADRHGRVVDAPEAATPRSRGLVSRLPIKVSAIVSELLGQFPGLEHGAWYVSDGGHFENTAIYPLIKRELPLIVAADCGADPKYLFEDLESLVRKVRIDFGADIEFIAPEDIGEDLAPDLKPLLGTPESIDPEAADACLVLARIRYRSGAVGTLLVVKPRRLNHLPFDVVAYADRNAAFPQQSTGDQFFDEAQWESYQRLGHLIGGRLTPARIAQARAVVGSDIRAYSRLTGAQQAREQAHDKARARVSRLRPTVTATAAGTGLGLSLMVALWQGWSEYRDSRRQEVEKAALQGRALVAEIEKGRVPADASRVLALLRQQRVEGAGSHATVLEALDACSLRGVRDCALLRREIAENEARARRDYWRNLHAERPQTMLAAAVAPAVGVGTTDGRSTGVDETTTTGPTTAGPDEGIAPDDASLPPDDEPVVGTSPQTGAPVRRVDDRAGRAAVCAGRRVYLHIYDETSRTAAGALADGIETGLGQRPVGIENVAATAMRKGRRAPYVWRRPAVLFGDGQRGRVEACARAIATTIDGLAGEPVATVRVLRTRTARDAVEVWLPPRSTLP
jgi:cytochrome b561